MKSLTVKEAAERISQGFAEKDSARSAPRRAKASPGPTSISDLWAAQDELSRIHRVLDTAFETPDDPDVDGLIDHYVARARAYKAAEKLLNPTRAGRFQWDPSRQDWTPVEGTA